MQSVLLRNLQETTTGSFLQGHGAALTETATGISEVQLLVSY